MGIISQYSPSAVAFHQTDIPDDLVQANFLFSQTAQYYVVNGAQRTLIYLPFGINGGPLYFDYLLFQSRLPDQPFQYVGAFNNNLHQGSSGHYYVKTISSQSVIVVDSGKEWIGSAGEAVWQELGYDYLQEPPQNYTQFPLGYLFKIAGIDGSPYVTQTALTNFRAYNHSVAAGDFNGDGREDYVVSGQSTSDVDSSYWARIGYIAVAQANGTYSTTWITSPNLEGVGTKKFGMSNVVAVDLTGDGKDEFIFSGGASNATSSDKVLVAYQLINGQVQEYSSVLGYGKFLTSPGYNAYAIDYDRDGDQDLLNYFGTNTVGFELLENTGSGQFRKITGNLGLDGLSVSDFKQVQILDFDHDGYEDIILDNLTPYWGLEFDPTQLSKAFIKNNSGQSFSFINETFDLTLSSEELGPDYQTVVTNFVGKTSTNTYQFATSYQNSNSQEFGVVTHEVSFTSFGVASVSNDWLAGAIGNDVIYGLSGADTLIGGYGADTLDGGAGRDILNNDAGTDRMVGGLGADIYLVSDGSAVISEEASTEANLGRNVGLFDAAVEQRLQKFYMAYYGRPSDYDGTAYWKSTLANNLGGSELRMAGFFGNPLQTEFANLYGVNTTNPEFLDRVYLNLFNRVADTEGRAYWAGIIQNKVAGGMITDNARAEVVIQIMDGAQGSDAALIATKQANATVLSKWIAQLDADNAYGDANNTDGFAAARTWLSAVGSDESSTSPMSLLARYVLSDVLDAQAEDQIETSVSYTLPTAVEVIKATGISAITLTGNAENNQLIGNGYGSTLTGAAGADLFVVNTLATTPDRISDFVSGTDVLVLDIASLSLNPGTISVQMNTVSGTDAALVYNTTTGALSYDADGVGTQAATVLITLVGAPTLTLGDVWVV